MAVGAMGFVALYGTVLFGCHVRRRRSLSGRRRNRRHRDDHRRGHQLLHLEWGWMVDGLSIMMYFVVGVVGLFVFIYAKSYMKGDIRYTWFFASSRCSPAACWCWSRPPT